MGLAADLFYRLGRRLNISEIVGRFENAKHVHAVFDRALDELVNDAVRVRPVGQNMLAAQKHLQFSLGHDGFDAPESIPRIFLQVAHADIEGRPAPNFHGVKAAISIDAHSGKNRPW